MERDIPRAVELLEGLKENDFYGPLALCRLGLLRTSAPEVWDMARGMDELRLAAGQGNAYAACALGRIYLYGQGEYRNPELGRAYLQRAVELGSEQAAQLLERAQTPHAQPCVGAVLRLLRLFERAVAPHQEQQRKPASDHILRRKEQEKKQAQGMKLQ